MSSRPFTWTCEICGYIHQCGEPPGNSLFCGADDVVVPVDTKAYSMMIDWWDSYYEDYDQATFLSMAVTSPEQIVRLSNYPELHRLPLGRDGSACRRHVSPQFCSPGLPAKDFT